MTLHAGRSRPFVKSRSSPAHGYRLLKGYVGYRIIELILSLASSMPQELSDHREFGGARGFHSGDGGATRNGQALSHLAGWFRGGFCLCSPLEGGITV